MPLLALIALFIAIPLAELYVIIEVVGEAIGPVWTIVILAAGSVLGSLLLKSQGRAVWRRFNEALAGGRVPHREVVDGVLVIFGGALLITPGFLTDIVGLALLIKPTRALIRRFVTARLGQRIAVGVVDRAGSRRRPPRSYDVDGSASEYEPPPGRLPR